MTKPYVKKPSKEKILEAIKDSGGIISLIAKKLNNASWIQTKRWIESFPETKEAHEHQIEGIIDMAESKLFDRIQQGDSQDIKWFLSKKGKHRGYGDVQSVEHLGEIELRIVREEDDVKIPKNDKPKDKA